MSRLGLVMLTLKTTKHTMAAITYAYMALAAGRATPTQLYQVDLAQKALPELDRIRDMTNPVNRRKLRTIAENFARNYLADGADDDIDEAIVQCYMDDTVETHEELYDWLMRLAQPHE
jgi:hypothetical protein